MSNVSISGIVSSVVCIAHDSEILSSSGQRIKIQDLQRGDEIQEGRFAKSGKVCRVIGNQLSPSGIVEAVVLEKRTILCADHYLVYAGKRRLGRSLIAFPGVKFVRGRVDSVLPRAEDSNCYFYDIQYDHEGEYVVNGLISQSRSPYASVSPLPLEMYYEKENYKEVRVSNTLTSEPEITYKYLLPSGEEVESLVLLRPSSSEE